MILLVTVALCLGFAGWLTTEVLPVIELKWRRESELGRDRLTLDRDIHEAAERRYVTGNKHDPRPADLEGRIQAWEDEWARGDERKTQDDLYAELRSWDRVRQSLRAMPSQDESFENGMVQ